MNANRMVNFMNENASVKAQNNNQTNFIPLNTIVEENNYGKEERKTTQCQPEEIPENEIMTTIDEEGNYKIEPVDNEKMRRIETDITKANLKKKSTTSENSLKQFNEKIIGNNSSQQNSGEILLFT